MKKVLAAIAMTAVLVLSWVIPANAATYPWGGGSGYDSLTSGFSYRTGSGTVQADLFYGTTQVGSVKVWETPAWQSPRFLYVSFNTIGWLMTKTSLKITQSAYFNTWNQPPALFDQTNPQAPPVLSFLYTINETLLKNNNSLYMYASADVKKVSGIGQGTAWATLGSTPAWKLPFNSIKIQLVKYFNATADPHHYLEVILSNVPAGYSIQNGLYAGWCADDNVDWGPSTPPPGVDPKTWDPLKGVYTAKVYSSLDLAHVPGYAKDTERWDMINYIINHRDPTFSWGNVQDAIWYFTDGLQPGSDLSTDPLFDAAIVKHIVDDALAHPGFVPGAGQIGAVIIDRNCGKDQLFFIEIETPGKCVEGTCYKYNCDQQQWYPCGSFDNDDNCYQNNWYQNNCDQGHWYQQYCQGTSYQNKFCH